MWLGLFIFILKMEMLKIARHYCWLPNRGSKWLVKRCGVFFGPLTCLKILKTFEATFKN